MAYLSPPAQTGTRIMSSFILGLVAGVLGDALRSVLAPSTTDLISKTLAVFFPSLRKKTNIEANLQALEALSKAKAAGVAPESIHFLDCDPRIFLSRIGFASAAFRGGRKFRYAVRRTD